jgi:hypothetical protein
LLKPSAALPLPDEAQEASYFAAPARSATFSPRSIMPLYIGIGFYARGMGFAIIGKL